MPSESAVAQVWTWSLVIYFVVVGQFLTREITRLLAPVEP